jgi:hypothetical protein
MLTLWYHRHPTNHLSKKADIKIHHKLTEMFLAQYIQYKAMPFGLQILVIVNVGVRGQALLVLSLGTQDE